MESPGGFLVVFEVYLYGPPPILSKTNLREFLWFFLSFMCSLGCKSVIDLIHHFAKMVKQRVYTK